MRDRRTTQARKVQNSRQQGGEFQDPFYLELGAYCLKLIIQGDNDEDRNKSREGLELGGQCVRSSQEMKSETTDRDVSSPIDRDGKCTSSHPAR